MLTLPADKLKYKQTSKEDISSDQIFYNILSQVLKIKNGSIFSGVEQVN